MTPRRPQSSFLPELIALKHIVLIGSAYDHSFAVDKKGVVFAWGKNAQHQCGVDPSHPASREDVIVTPTVVASLHPDEHDGARV